MILYDITRALNSTEYIYGKEIFESVMEVVALYSLMFSAHLYQDIGFKMWTIILKNSFHYNNEILYNSGSKSLKSMTGQLQKLSNSIPSSMPKRK